VGTREKRLHPDDAEQLRAIGQALRDTRRGRHTLDGLAARAGVSAGQLSQIENGRGNPTVEMLIRIGASLDVDVVDLLERQPPKPTYVVRAAERRKHVLSNDRALSLLTPGLRHEFTVTHNTLEPGESYATAEYHGDSIFYVQQGQLSVHTGTTTHILAEEDSMLCRAVLRLTNAASRPSVFICAFRPEGD